MQFTKAERKKVMLRLALTGPSGSGKTLGALMIAKGLGGRVAVIDTEQGSASLYADRFDFDTLDLRAPYSPERYIDAINMAEKAGYNVLVIDSATHEWNSVGGCLELCDQIAKAKYKGNSWSAWNEVTPRHRKFIDTILQCGMHVICTMRSKTETAQSQDERGRTRVVKLGMKAEQRDGVDFEFTIVLDLIHDGHFYSASKDRTGLFGNIDPRPIDESVGVMILDWINSGAEPAPDPAPEQEHGEEKARHFRGQIKQAAKKYGCDVSRLSDAILAYAKHAGFEGEPGELAQSTEWSEWVISRLPDLAKKAKAKSGEN